MYALVNTRVPLRRSHLPRVLPSEARPALYHSRASAGGVCHLRTTCRDPRPCVATRCSISVSSDARSGPSGRISGRRWITPGSRNAGSRCREPGTALGRSSGARRSACRPNVYARLLRAKVDSWESRRCSDRSYSIC